MTKKVKLPKRVAGMKVPKELRKTAERAIEQAQTPQGREMIAAGLSMAAAAASAAVVRARAEREKTAAQPGPPAAAPATPPTPPVSPVPPHVPEGATKPSSEQMAEAFGQVADQVLGRLFGGKR